MEETKVPDYEAIEDCAGCIVDEAWVIQELMNPGHRMRASTKQVVVDAVDLIQGYLDAIRRAANVEQRP